MNGRPTTARAAGALVALSLSSFTYVTTETQPIGLLLPIAQDLHTTASAVGLLVTCYGLVVVATSIPLTHLTRRIPRRFLMSALLAVFVVATLVSAGSRTYPVLLGARVVTALSQALFWSVVVPTAAGLFSEKARGRAIGLVFAGSSLAAVLGVPAGTWLGQQAGWRAAFLALSAIGLIALVGVAWLLPTERAGRRAARPGTTPDARRYWLLMAMVTLTVTGSFVVYTYVTPFLTEIALFSLAAIGPLLLVRGIAGVVGVSLSGPLVDRGPWLAIVVPVVLQVVAFFGLYALGRNQIAAVILVAVSGLSFAVLTTALSNRVLQVAPGSVDLAASGASTAVNVGITAGALIGSVLLPAFGVRSVALVGGLLTLGGLTVVVAEPLFLPPLPRPVTGAVDAAREEPDLAYSEALA
jgi:DHA1 family inner membrane transport protein